MRPTASACHLNMRSATLKFSAPSCAVKLSESTAFSPDAAAAADWVAAEPGSFIKALMPANEVPVPVPEEDSFTEAARPVLELVGTAKAGEVAEVELEEEDGLEEAIWLTNLSNTVLVADGLPLFCSFCIRRRALQCSNTYLTEMWKTLTCQVRKRRR